MTALLAKESQTKTLFEQALADMDIIYHRIRVATPRHNGKVEGSTEPISLDLHSPY